MKKRQIIAFVASIVILIANVIEVIKSARTPYQGFFLSARASDKEDSAFPISGMVDGDYSDSLVKPEWDYSLPHTQEQVNAEFCGDTRSISITGGQVAGLPALTINEIASIIPGPITQWQPATASEPFYSMFVQRRHGHLAPSTPVVNAIASVRIFRRAGSGRPG